MKSKSLFFMSILPIFLVLLALPPSAFANHDIASCPFQITGPGTWTVIKDLPNCTPYGVDIPFGIGNVTLNINGYTISGLGGRTVGVLCDAGNTCTVVGYGPGSSSHIGTITAFGVGVEADYGGTTVRHVHLTSNGTGLADGGTYGGDTFAYNTITGSFVAINANNAQHDKIIGNTIAGNGTGMFLQIPSGVISRNVIVSNTNLSLFLFGPQDLLITENEVSFNGAGIQLLDPEGGVTIQNNAVSSNTGDGIQIAGLSGEAPPYNKVTGNTVGNNTGNGIAVISDPEGNPADYNQVKYNVVIGNGTSGTGVDLFWNGLGSHNSWHNNHFDTCFLSCQ